MIELYHKIIAFPLLLGALATIFISAAAFVFWLMTAGEEFMAEYKEKFTENADANAADMFMTVDAGRLFVINLVSVVLIPVLILVITHEWIIPLGVFVFLLFVPVIIYRIMHKKRLKKFEEQLPDGLIMMAGSMQAGASLNIAIDNLIKEQPAPLSQEFELLNREQRIGVDFELSLDHMDERVPIQDFAMFTSAIKINRDIGGNLAEILKKLSDTLRKKHQMEGKIDSLTAQGRLQGIVMTGLPVLLGLLLYFLEKDAMSQLWTTKVGYVVLAVIIIMEFLGYIMIKKITTINV
jgi:tight adherence protein B